MSCFLALVLCAVAAGGPTARGFDHFYNLEYDEAIVEFAAAIERDPASAEAYNHLAMAILYRDLLRAGALESEMVTGNNPFLRRPKVEAGAEDRRRFDAAIRRAMELSQARLKANPRDADALYALGVSYGLRANHSFLVRKAWRDALRDATTARKTHNRVTELQPSRHDARLLQGLHDFVVGSLPWHWRMLGFLVGYRGDKDEGIRTLELVASKGDANRVDAEVLLCAIYRRENKPRRAVPLLEDLMRRYPRNYLLPMELAQMWSDLGDKHQALAALDIAERAARRRIAPERIAFARGTVQFWYGDLDDALANMRRAAAAAEDLGLNIGVLAWMRLGQIHDLRGERAEARQAYQRAIAFAPESDAAKESQRYLDRPYRKA